MSSATISTNKPRDYDTYLSGKSIGFVGAGNMAWAIFKNMFNIDGFKVDQVTVSAPSDRNLGKWKEAGAKTTHNNNDIFMYCDIIILAMKPQHFKDHWQGARAVPEERETIFISVLAGVATHNIEQILFQRNCTARNPTVIRTMPNTAMTVGLGTTIICPGTHTKRHSIDTAKLIFGAGECLVEEVSESLLDAGGALVGCGPAFVYQFIESLSDGAVAQAVPRDLANRLTAQMVMGAAKMVQETGKHPGLLKDEVCSPGGTTIAGIHALKKGQNFSVAIMDAIEASTARSKQLNN